MNSNWKGLEPSGNPILDEAAKAFADKEQEWVEKVPEIFLPARVADEIEKERKEPEWELHTGAGGETYWCIDTARDKYGRLIHYHEKPTSETNRTQRRAAGIRAPLAFIEAYNQAAAEMIQELLTEMGTQPATLEGEAHGEEN